jgi:4-hydroxy-tetrahydrodipicolinate reductase
MSGDSADGAPDRIVVTGATGRMGREVLAACEVRGLNALAVSESDPDAANGDSLGEYLQAGDVLVDFTVPEASLTYLEAAVEAGVPAVVGTTGYDDHGEARIPEAAEEIPVLRASNFARGVQALLGAVHEAVAALPGYDVEVTETHHNGKRDAPSGTALTVLDEIDEARGEGLNRTYGREGHHPRQENEVGVHVRRAGDVKGEHQVLLAGNEEVLTLTHRAESRGVFAAGALDAAAWLVGREAGLYAFEELI